MDRPGSDSGDATTDCVWGMFEDTLSCGVGRISSGPTQSAADRRTSGHWRRVLMFNGSQSLIQAWARVVRGVYSRRNTAVELDLLNRKAAWSTWYMNGRDVFLRNTLPARPLTPDNLDGALRNFALELRGNRDELAYRLGGSLA